MARDEKHAFIKIGEDIKTGNIPAVILLHGNEEFLVDFYAEALIKKYVNKACELLDLSIIDRNDVTVSSVIDNFETMPLMSERKVVYLPHFIDSGAKMSKLFSNKSESIDELSKYIESIGRGGESEENRLLLITIPKQKDERNDREIKKLSIYKAISKVGAIYDFTALGERQLRSFIEKRFIAAGKFYRPGIIEMIVDETGYGNKGIDYGLFNLDNDLKKIIAHCGNSNEICRDDVMNVITVSPENNVFDMLDAVSRNRKEEAFRLLHNLLEDGSSAFQILALLTKQFELMLTVCEMKDSGMNLKAIQAELKKTDKIHEFRTKKAHETGARFRKEGLKKILSAAYEVEPNIKTGLMSEQLALEYFIAVI